MACATTISTKTDPKTAHIRSSQKVSEKLLAVIINDQHYPPDVDVLSVNSDIYISIKDLRRWRIILAHIDNLLYFEGDTFYPLNNIKGLHYYIDEAKQLLVIEAEVTSFEMTNVKGSLSGFSVPEPASLGGFVNYDFSLQSATSSTQINSLFELGAFNRWGVGLGTFIARDLSNNRDIVRLDSSFIMDNPKKLNTIIIGDAINNGSSWGRPVRFGGIQWASNFQSQPDFITFPLPSITGEAVLPSVIDVYIDNVKQFNSSVESGPFSISNIPVMTGLQDMQLVVRDVLGREQLITQRYYVSPQLLRENLQAYSYEVGMIRENYTQESNDYGQHFISGTHRYGINNHFTSELHGEWLSNQYNLGLGGAYLMPEWGVFNAAIAGSNSEELGRGALFSFGFERQTSQLSFGGNVQRADKTFTQLGLTDTRRVARLSSSAHIGIATANNSSVGLNYIYQDYYNQSNVNLASAYYSRSIAKGWSCSLSIFRDMTESDNHSAMLVLSYSLDDRTTSTASLTHNDNGEGALFQVQKNLPYGSGMGYRILAGREESDRAEVGINLQNDIGTYALEATRFNDLNYLRGSASGGLAMMNNAIFPSRRINESFAIIEVQEQAGVRIYAENQLVATTDRHGRALVPALRPYQKNQIRIEQADLPLTVQAETFSMTATPYFRSGTALNFPVATVQAATLILHLENGQPVPAGAKVSISGYSNIFPVGLKGKLYVTGLSGKTVLQAIWHEQHCQFIIDLQSSEDPLPDLGTIICYSHS